jgi:hypothetical protein
MKAKIFEYAILYHPKPKKDANGNEVTEKSEIVKEVSRVLAESDKQVGILAAREIPEKYLNELDNVEIIVRPFA